MCMRAHPPQEKNVCAIPDASPVASELHCILGPILFILYMNNLPTSVQFSSVLVLQITSTVLNTSKSQQNLTMEYTHSLIFSSLKRTILDFKLKSPDDRSFTHN